MSSILVTGSAGFIGYHLFKRLQKQGHQVLGIDSLNNYYDVKLKLARLQDCGFASEEIAAGKMLNSKQGGSFLQMDLSDRLATQQLFSAQQFDYVCHLAAQAGVRYSLENPHAYIDSNITGFLNVLEGCRMQKPQHLLYASSSSVYGNSEQVPFSVQAPVDKPISLYAASKKSNELMAHCYSQLFDIPCTGLRFFTVYGPWGRPDMALFKFTRAILAGQPLPLFNHGRLSRDFTYIDDIIEGIWRVLFQSKPEQPAFCRLYNIGNGKPVALLDFVRAIETATGKKACIDPLPMQPGDVKQTWADTEALQKDFGFRSQTEIQEGVRQFVEWYRGYYA